MQWNNIDVVIVGLDICLYDVEQRCVAFFLLSFGQPKVLLLTRLGGRYRPEAIERPRIP